MFHVQLPECISHFNKAITKLTIMPLHLVQHPPSICCKFKLHLFDVSYRLVAVRFSPGVYENRRTNTAPL